MTVDEAIEMYANNAEYERTHGSLQGCMDFRQLAEWLKDYKRLKEQEPKTGKWIDIMVGDMPAQACDQCNTFYPLAYTGGGHNFCPNCGAEMESEDGILDKSTQ